MIRFGIRTMPNSSSALSPLAKARAYCARQERCQQEVRDKLYAWEVPSKETEAIIAQLIGEGFLNEARYAEHEAFTGSPVFGDPALSQQLLQFRHQRRHVLLRDAPQRFIVHAAIIVYDAVPQP